MTPLQLVIEAVQHTPDRDPVVIQYSAKPPATGPLSSSQQLHTTQTALSARSGVADYWSDAETKAELLAHLEAHGIAAEIVANVVDVQPDVPVEPTRLEEHTQLTAEANA